MVNIPWQVSCKSKGGGKGAKFAIYIRNLSYVALEDVGDCQPHTIGPPPSYMDFLDPPLQVVAFLHFMISYVCILAGYRSALPCYHTVTI